MSNLRTYVVSGLILEPNIRHTNKFQILGKKEFITRMLTVCVLGSGSSGNCIYVGSAQTRLLIDAGLSAPEIARRLAQAGGDLSRIDAVCVTHEHSDHCQGLRSLHLRHAIPVFLNEPTANALEQLDGFLDMRWTIFRSGEPFEIGDLSVFPLGVSHDASEPVGFIVSPPGGPSLGIVTDLGMVTEGVALQLRQCDAVILEFNHDPDRLWASSRPRFVKERIAGQRGHLSNAAAAALVADLTRGPLHTVFLAHLSKACNHPDLAVGELRRVFRERGLPPPRLHLTYPDRIGEVVQIGVP